MRSLSHSNRGVETNGTSEFPFVRRSGAGGGGKNETGRDVARRLSACMEPGSRKTNFCAPGSAHLEPFTTAPDPAADGSFIGMKETQAAARSWAARAVHKNDIRISLPQSK